jgi:hypothetical protein
MKNIYRPGSISAFLIFPILLDEFKKSFRQAEGGERALFKATVSFYFLNF